MSPTTRRPPRVLRLLSVAICLFWIASVGAQPARTRKPRSQVAPGNEGQACPPDVSQEHQSPEAGTSSPLAEPNLVGGTKAKAPRKATKNPPSGVCKIALQRNDGNRDSAIEWLKADPEAAKQFSFRQRVMGTTRLREAGNKEKQAAAMEAAALSHWTTLKGIDARNPESRQLFESQILQHAALIHGGDKVLMHREVKNDKVLRYLNPTARMSVLNSLGAAKRTTPNVPWTADTAMRREWALAGARTRALYAAAAQEALPHPETAASSAGGGVHGGVPGHEYIYRSSTMPPLHGDAASASDLHPGLAHQWLTHFDAHSSAGHGLLAAPEQHWHPGQAVVQMHATTTTTTPHLAPWYSHSGPSQPTVADLPSTSHHWPSTVHDWPSTSHHWPSASQDWPSTSGHWSFNPGHLPASSSSARPPSPPGAPPGVPPGWHDDGTKEQRQGRHDLFDVVRLGSSSSAHAHRPA